MVGHGKKSQGWGTAILHWVREAAEKVRMGGKDGENRPRRQRGMRKMWGCLSLQQVNGLGEIGDADVAGQPRVLALEGEVHLPGDAAIAEVPGGGGAEL